MTQDRDLDGGDHGKETVPANKGMSDMEISQNSLILATAGSDSTTTTLCGVLYHLARPAGSKARAALLAEIRSAFASESEISFASTTPASLPYLNACIEETMRVYPSTAEQPPRVSPGEVVGERFVPQGTKVYTYQWSTHRNPEHFECAQEFHPERFLPRSHSLYDARFEHDELSLVRPFSHGPRDCVGRNLAYGIVRLTLANLLYRFDYELSEPEDDWIEKQTVKFSWTKGPLNIKLVPRGSRD
ncbi:Putative cytochrome P450 [Colletotrichum destructivum]|uniref:Cytochrome P450 n=1 Tax=Colletotrichum destructivum TaxID=34406 RepID=A0AAX4IBU9_9PEZI|nr:Putative cytochrome P450 [Colletotrichum destructivum]